MNCGFCKDKENNENNKRIIIETKLSKVFPSNQPIVLGHTIIIPKRCVPNFEDLTINEKNDIFELMTKIKLSLKNSFNCKGFNHAWNENIIAGQTVPHFHLHIVPRKKGDDGIYEYEPRKFLYRPNSRENSPNQELIKIAQIIKNNL